MLSLFLFLKKIKSSIISFFYPTVHSKQLISNYFTVAVTPIVFFLSFQTVNATTNLHINTAVFGTVFKALKQQKN